jgi:glycosyltransferase involved in cell wall biosynthesis
MNANPIICCLTATYGRLSKLNEVVTCFLEQDYNNKKLIILNNHPIPLSCNFPNVTVYNEPIYPTLGDCRNRLIELAEGDFIRTWDDDDLYLPWTLSQGIENIGNAVAWKPTRSWFWMRGKTPQLVENVFEASMLVQLDIAKKSGYSKNSMGDEHIDLIRGIDKEGGCKKTEMGILASYVYRWGWGMWHTSGTIGSGIDVKIRTKEWCNHNQDIQDGVIKMVQLEDYWKSFPTWNLKTKTFNFKNLL